MKNRLVPTCLLCLVAFSLLLLTSQVNAQQPSQPPIDETLEKEGCATNEQSKVKICKYDYLADGKKKHCSGV